MPDPLKQTISATEAPALFNVSPYLTRFMLFHRFSTGVEVKEQPNVRMNFGQRAEAILLEMAAEEMRLEVRPNRGTDGKQVYVRRGLLGCTRDAMIICPDRGPGALETKMIFDYETWMHDMDGGRVLPKYHEIQLQQQMLVGDGEKPFTWGTLAVCVAGQPHYFEREPIPDLWKMLEDEAAIFFDDVKNMREPDPFGAPVENALIQKLYRPNEEKILDLRGTEQGEDLAKLASDYALAGMQESIAKKTKAKVKTKLIGTAKEHGEIWLPDNIIVELTTRKMKQHVRLASISTTVKVRVPGLKQERDEDDGHEDTGAF